MARKKKAVTPVAVGAIYELPISRIAPAPWNRRKINPDGESVKGLAQSIREIGQQEPVLVRPTADGWELVYGHRRLVAVSRIAMANGGAKKATIKAVIREMTDEEAKLANAVENLQRENLTEMEEAQQFADFFDAYGERAPEVLAEKLGITSRYVRKRIAVARLPRPLLKAWEKGLLSYSHLEVMLRVNDRKDQLVILRDLYRQYLSEGEVPSAKRLNEWVEPDGVRLDLALFDAAGCTACGKNTGTQLSLFGLPGEIKCTDADCFKNKQLAWTLENWERYSERLKAGAEDPNNAIATNTFAFEFEKKPCIPLYWRKPTDQCRTCPDFGATLTLGGDVGVREACFGPQGCFEEKYSPKAQTAQPALSIVSPNGKNESVKEEEKPRVEWHGEFFRQEFYKEQIPAKFSLLSEDDPKHTQLVIFLLAHAHPEVRGFLQKALGVDETTGYFGCDRFLPVLAGLGEKESALLLRRLTQELVFKSRVINDLSRRCIADFVGVDLSDWQLTEDYLIKKTKREIVQIILETGLMQDPAFLRRLRVANVDMNAENLLSRKKDYLVSMIMDSEADLRGKIPKEILRFQFKAATDWGEEVSEAENTPQPDLPLSESETSDPETSEPDRSVPDYWDLTKEDLAPIDDGYTQDPEAEEEDGPAYDADPGFDQRVPEEVAA